MGPRAVALVAGLLVLLSAGGRVGAAYTKATAETALNFARASYCGAASIGGWSCGPCAANPGLAKVRVFANASQGTQAFMGVSASRIVVSFRGSQNIPNWVDDLDFRTTSYAKPNCTGCKAHSGFCSAFESLQEAMWGYLQELVGAHPTLPLLITGHSLGGAMARLAAADFASRPYASGAAPRIELYTFGEPRVGNAAFADWFLALFCTGGHEAFRVTHKRDVVPHLPPAYLGYTHAPHEVWYDNDGSTSYANCSDVAGAKCPAETTAEDAACSDSVLPTSIADHLKYLGGCTSCTCVADATMSDDMLRISPELEWVIALDYVYKEERLAKRFLSHSSFWSGADFQTARATGR